MAGWPGRSTALAMMVAAASACDAVFASTVTASAMPSEKLRPCRPLVAMPRAGSSASIVDRSHQAMPVRPVHQADGELLAAGQMQRDVAAIIDVSAVEPRRGQHRAENFFRDAARHRRHRRDEVIGRKRRDRRMHAARDDPFSAHRTGSAAFRSSTNSSQSSSSRPVKRRAAAS